MIIEEGSSTAQEKKGAPQNYMPPYGEILVPPRHYGGVPM
jgi:hypothetical protein